ncbi:serine/threonine-protein kinase [Streptomyces sp. NPDC052396]|uniref:serine/threonine-protein kinase n=1 Tax=Streptomyces sp. NPDC052396 TaxID=3365689 RepID=UPI0037D5455E
MEALRPQDPARIGAHTVLARLGSGGMGQVYLGRSPGGLQLAIKVIRDDFAQSQEALTRFRREVETARAVHGAYTAQVVDASLAAAPYWLATEYVPGPTLSQALALRGPLPAETCFRLFAALAEALAQVHGFGVTHRDLKPHNVMLAPGGPKLIDFGIARTAEQTALTQLGTAPGTPGYAAPEVITRNEVGPAADVFALGATMACAATGRPPYGEGSLESVTYRVVHDSIDVDGVAPELAALIEDCVAADPERRPDPARIIERCGVASALADDPAYGALTLLGERAPADLAAARAAGLVPPGHGTELGGGPVAPGAGYIPTLAPGTAGVPGTPGSSGTASPQAAAPRRSRRGLLLGVGAASVVLGVLVGLVVLRPDHKGDGQASASAGGAARGAVPTTAGRTPGVKATGAATASSGPSTSGPSPVDAAEPIPQYIEQKDVNRDFWQPRQGAVDLRDGQCSMPPEERADLFQMGVDGDRDASGALTSDKATVSFRLKMDLGKLPRPYYVAVAVKSWHALDPATGKPWLGSPNLGIGWTSKPVDLFARDPREFVNLRYPQDFQRVTDGKTDQAAPPLSRDPGNWTVLYFHVKGPKDYASIGCDGFVAK